MVYKVVHRQIFSQKELLILCLNEYFIMCFWSNIYDRTILQPTNGAKLPDFANIIQDKPNIKNKSV